MEEKIEYGNYRGREMRLHSEHVEATDNMVEDQVSKSEQQSYVTILNEQEHHQTPLETRQNICRTSNVVRVLLAAVGFNISIEVIT
ncbi:hypothetical protein RJ641_021829 [Dillenia turbinata]|uniref:Uncharacterized protein n=1 Tax=Dillenia turbinata TaxID=194707 RepID=A0AAN8YYT8_9MAGN